MVKAKKSLGQNFLIDKNIINKIVNLVNIKNKIILEVGPGTGNLTQYILKQNPKKIVNVWFLTPNIPGGSNIPKIIRKCWFSNTKHSRYGSQIPKIIRKCWVSDAKLWNFV